MTSIKSLTDDIKDELKSAKNHAEQYVLCKAKDNDIWSKRYHEMATDELKHAGYIHDRAVVEVDKLNRACTVPEYMMRKWDADHKMYVDRVEWIRQMLDT